MPTLALTTDFGLSDGYVAAVKGVVLSIARDVTFVDVTHDISPQDVVQGAYVLSTVVRFLPKGTVHLAVVDPGVGTRRRPIALRCGGSYFVGPDNGLMSLGVEELLGGSIEAPLDPSGDLVGPATMIEVEVPAEVEAVELVDPSYRLDDVSDTFQGRDIFAAAAAHICLGVELSKMGPRIETIRWFRLARPVKQMDGLIEAQILSIDHYGNAITTLRYGPQMDGASVEVGGRSISAISTSYADGPDELVAIWGSSGRLEVAVRNGSAAQALGLTRGDRILVRLPV